MIARLRFLFLSLALAAVMPLVGGCGHKGGGSAAIAPPADNVLRVAMTASPTTFNPAMVQDGTTDQYALSRSSKGWCSGRRRTRWPRRWRRNGIGKDGLTYTFHLRPGVKFQDGNPVTAQDVYYSMRRALNPKLASPVAIIYMGDIVGADEERSGKTASACPASRSSTRRPWRSPSKSPRPTGSTR